MSQSNYYTDPALDQLIKKIYKRYKNYQVFGTTFVKLPPYTTESLQAAFLTNQWQQILINGQQIFKNLNETEFLDLCSLVDKINITPFIVMVTLIFAQKRHFMTFKEFLAHLKYIAKYIDYQKRMRKYRPREKCNVKTCLCFSWTSEMESKNETMPKNKNRYQRNPNWVHHDTSFAYSTGSMIPLTDFNDFTTGISSSNDDFCTGFVDSGSCGDTVGGA
uniref:CSON007993 protein n=1 Tax=Culicoides sonorensis TaxID=179676 RepID=A0A336MXJ5_CULSO